MGSLNCVCISHKVDDESLSNGNSINASECVPMYLPSKDDIKAEFEAEKQRQERELNRIKQFNIGLVYGYIRQDIQDENDSFLIPSDIKQLIFDIYDTIRLFGVGDTIDVRSKVGFWYKADIVYHKMKGDALTARQKRRVKYEIDNVTVVQGVKHTYPDNEIRDNFNRITIEDLNGFECIVVSELNGRGNEWIFFDHETVICDCWGANCNVVKEERYIWKTGYHRITKPDPFDVKRSYEDYAIIPV